jgi:hypothetical protein
MRNHDDGFTLAEALIATVLTLIMVSAGLGAFTNAMGLADVSRIISETNESLQVAESLMVRDCVQIGQGIPRGGIPIPTGGGALAVKRPGPPGSNLTFPAAWTTLPAVSPGGSFGPVVLGATTDQLTLLYADATLALNQYPLVNIAANGTSMTVDNRTSIAGADGLHVGDIIMFSNALGNALQMITQTNNNQIVNFQAGDALRLNQPGAAQGSILSLQTAGAYPPTTATRVWMVSYYIDTVTDPTLPRLTRQVNSGTRLAIALGVENMQIAYDLVDGINNPTNVETPPAANSPNQIRKITLFLTARSLDINAHTKQYFRNSVTTEIGLRSLSFMDRYK